MPEATCQLAVWLDKDTWTPGEILTGVVQVRVLQSGLFLHYARTHPLQLKIYGKEKGIFKNIPQMPMRRYMAHEEMEYFKLVATLPLLDVYSRLSHEKACVQLHESVNAASRDPSVSQHVGSSYASKHGTIHSSHMTNRNLYRTASVGGGEEDVMPTATVTTAGASHKTSSLPPPAPRAAAVAQSTHYNNASSAVALTGSPSTSISSILVDPSTSTNAGGASPSKSTSMATEVVGRPEHFAVPFAVPLPPDLPPSHCCETSFAGCSLRYRVDIKPWEGCSEGWEGEHLFDLTSDEAKKMRRKSAYDPHSRLFYVLSAVRRVDWEEAVRSSRLVMLSVPPRVFRTVAQRLLYQLTKPNRSQHILKTQSIVCAVQVRPSVLVVGMNSSDGLVTYGGGGPGSSRVTSRISTTGMNALQEARQPPLPKNSPVWEGQASKEGTGSSRDSDKEKESARPQALVREVTACPGAFASSATATATAVPCIRVSRLSSSPADDEEDAVLDGANNGLPNWERASSLSSQFGVAPDVGTRPAALALLHGRTGTKGVHAHSSSANFGSSIGSDHHQPHGTLAAAGASLDRTVSHTSARNGNNSTLAFDGVEKPQNGSATGGANSGPGTEEEAAQHRERQLEEYRLRRRMSMSQGPADAVVDEDAMESARRDSLYCAMDGTEQGDGSAGDAAVAGRQRHDGGDRGSYRAISREAISVPAIDLGPARPADLSMGFSSEVVPVTTSQGWSSAYGEAAASPGQQGQSDGLLFLSAVGPPTTRHQYNDNSKNKNKNDPRIARAAAAASTSSSPCRHSVAAGGAVDDSALQTGGGGGGLDPSHRRSRSPSAASDAVSSSSSLCFTFPAPFPSSPLSGGSAPSQLLLPKAFNHALTLRVTIRNVAYGQPIEAVRVRLLQQRTVTLYRVKTVGEFFTLATADYLIAAPDEGNVQSGGNSNNSTNTGSATPRRHADLATCRSSASSSPGPPQRPKHVHLPSTIPGGLSLGERVVFDVTLTLPSSVRMSEDFSDAVPVPTVQTKMATSETALDILIFKRRAQKPAFLPSARQKAGTSTAEEWWIDPDLAKSRIFFAACPVHIASIADNSNVVPPLPQSYRAKVLPK